MRYEQGTEELKPIADELIKLHHHHLLTARFAFLWREKAQKSKGKVKVAYVERFPAKFRPFFPGEEFDYLMTVAVDTWNPMPEAERIATIDHELCHCVAEEGEDGELDFGTVGHDIEEHEAVIERHGLYCPAVERMAEVMFRVRHGVRPVVLTVSCGPTRIMDPDEGDLPDLSGEAC